MSEDFNQEEMRNYLDLVLDLSFNSEQFFIIMGRKGGPFDEGDPVFYMIEGYHTEDVLGLIEETIGEVPN